MKKKRIVIGVLCAVIMLVLFMPKISMYKDGGTVEYKSLTYCIQDVHRIRENSKLNEQAGKYVDFEEGTIIEIFGIEVYNNVK